MSNQIRASKQSSHRSMHTKIIIDMFIISQPYCPYGCVMLLPRSLIDLIAIMDALVNGPAERKKNFMFFLWLRVH